LLLLHFLEHQNCFVFYKLINIIKLKGLFFRFIKTRTCLFRPAWQTRQQNNWVEGSLWVDTSFTHTCRLLPGPGWP